MKTVSATLALAVAMGAALYSAPSIAANARQPYTNIDKRVDKGNDTGDSRVPDLNQRSLDSVRSQSGYVVGAPEPVLGAPMMPMPLTPVR